jgi:hypothetical protein
MTGDSFYLLLPVETDEKHGNTGKHEKDLLPGQKTR